MTDAAMKEAVVRAETWQVYPDPELFEEHVLPALLPILERARSTPSREALGNWFEAFAPVVGVADEELATGTEDLLRDYPDEASNALETLPSGARARLALLLEGWPGGVAAPAVDVEAFASRFAGQLKTDFAALDNRPVLAAFTGESTFTSSRGHPVVRGTMTVKDRAGRVRGTYRVNSGGGASTYRKTNGPIPPGTYLVTNFLDRNKLGMVKHGIGYSLNLNPTGGTPVFGRSLFRIHPDGASPGTNGCLGIDEGETALAESRALLKELASQRSFLASVVYSGMG